MKTVLLIFASVALALGIEHFVLPVQNTDAAKPETAYERVMRTNTLRCAYGIYPPFLGKDPNSGQLNGISYDVMNAFAQVSGIAVEWGPEIDWGNIAATLQSGKADAFCSTMLLTPKRGRVLAASTPVFFTTIEAFVRSNDSRFDNDQERINQPDIRIAVNMGDLSEEVAHRLFPKAQLVYKGASGSEAELFLDVASQKSDVTLSGPTNLAAFNTANSAMALRKVPLPHSLMGFQGSIGVDIHESELLQLLNASLNSLIDSGTVDQILRNDLGHDYGTAYFPPSARFR